MKSLANKLIIYDSNCKVCSSLREVVLKLISIQEAKVVAFADLTPSLSERVDTDKFKNGMALIDTAGGDTMYGDTGVAYIFSSQYRMVDFLLRFKPLFALFSFLYKTTAYNRYIIATPKSKFKCDCFPDRVVRYRLNYITITFLIAIALTAMFGISLRKFVGVSASDAAIQMLLMAGSGWILQMVLAMLVLRDKALDYIGHLGSIMVVGLLILVPSMMFYAITDVLNPYLPAVSVILSSGCMLYLHVGRIRYLEFSQGWTVSWFVFLQSTAAFWIYFFYLK